MHKLEILWLMLSSFMHAAFLQGNVGGVTTVFLAGVNMLLSSSTLCRLTVLGSIRKQKKYHMMAISNTTVSSSYITVSDNE